MTVYGLGGFAFEAARLWTKTRLTGSVPFSVFAVPADDPGLDAAGAIRRADPHFQNGRRLRPHHRRGHAPLVPRRRPHRLHRLAHPPRLDPRSFFFFLFRFFVVLFFLVLLTVEGPLGKRQAAIACDESLISFFKEIFRQFSLCFSCFLVLFLHQWKVL